MKSQRGQATLPDPQVGDPEVGDHEVMFTKVSSVLEEVMNQRGQAALPDHEVTDHEVIFPTAQCPLLTDSCLTDSQAR